MRVILLWIVILIFSCTQDSSNTHVVSKVNAEKNDTLFFTILFEPAFEEVSLIKLLKIDTVTELHILIKNNRRAHALQDTFYYKTLFISQNEFSKIDTTLLRKTKIKYSQKQNIGVDGMSISFELIERGDTSKIGFWSPDKEDEILGYEMNKAAISNFKSLFNDQIIKEYFDDIEGYIDNEPPTSTSSKNIREIDRLRVEKYNWKKTKAHY